MVNVAEKIIGIEIDRLKIGEIINLLNHKNKQKTKTSIFEAC